MKTYVMGTNAIFYDLELLKTLRDNMFWWKLLWVYRSNWRVLHIDGFEGPLYPLPVSTGYKIKLFSYAEAA